MGTASVKGASERHFFVAKGSEGEGVSCQSTLCGVAETIVNK
jgi:hypothetical protein